MRVRSSVAYGIALLSVVAAVVTRFVLAAEFGDQVPFLPFLLATIFAAWLGGGAGPGLVSLVGGLVANHYVFGADRTRATAYLAVATIIVLLYDSLHRARRRAEQAQADAVAARERVAFLSDANVALMASLDWDETLRALARVIVPRIANWCAIDVVELDGSIRRAAVVHRDPEKADLAPVTAVYVPDPDGRHPRTAVIRTGRSELIRVITDDWLRRIAADADHLRIMRELDYRSGMVVALVARDRTLGAITCATTSGGRRYDADDLALLEDLAGRAAVALDNARLYRDAERARHEAQEANRGKDEFLSVVSHELKTPLSSTLAWLRVLRFAPEQAPRAIASMERSVGAQVKLIDDLLDVSRIAASGVRLESQPVDLARIVEAAIETFRPEADAKRIRLAVDLGPPASPIVGDPDRLQQAVCNLIGNAVKFTPADGSVRVRLTQDAATAEIVVEDTGRGIAPEFMPHVFERFRQADSVTSRDKGGLGLGLAIARHLIDLHGGTITAASEGVGKGARFTVALPASPVAARAAASAE